MLETAMQFIECVTWQDWLHEGSVSNFEWKLYCTPYLECPDARNCARIHAEIIRELSACGRIILPARRLARLLHQSREALHRLASFVAMSVVRLQASIFG